MRGVRFAPSPTGEFHIGNLRTAWISWRLAQELREPWVVRVEDIDTPRVVEGAWEKQRTDLAALGLHVDEVIVQSSRLAQHRETFARAQALGLVYACDCSRKTVADALATMASAPHGETPTYSGHCRARTGHPLSSFSPTVSGLAWRWKRRGAGGSSGANDPIVGRTTHASAESFFPAYHWACAVDDADGRYRLLVRAWDLATSEPVQREIRTWLQPNLSIRVFHTSLVVQADGLRLEKRTQGVTLDELVASGSSNTSVLRALERSFDLDRAVKQIAEMTDVQLLGEENRQLALSNLGL